MILLNLGCGTKTSPEVINMDWSIYLRIKQNGLLMALASLFIRGHRLQRLQELPANIKVHNLAKGIPYADNSVDAVYHSHFLEHLDRSLVDGFLQEVRRVLKPGGVHRIVVPDMVLLCQSYLEHANHCEKDPSKIPNHEEYIEEIIEQMVRRESYGSSRQSPLRRWIENRLLGDARKRGETHQWMYDRFNLGLLLEKNGYKSVKQCRFDQSSIPHWYDIGLDNGTHGDPYKPGSLYLEALK